MQLQKITRVAPKGSLSRSSCACVVARRKSQRKSITLFEGHSRCCCKYCITASSAIHTASVIRVGRLVFSLCPPAANESLLPYSSMIIVITRQRKAVPASTTTAVVFRKHSRQLVHSRKKEGTINHVSDQLFSPASQVMMMDDEQLGHSFRS